MSAPVSTPSVSGSGGAGTPIDAPPPRRDPNRVPKRLAAGALVATLGFGGLAAVDHIRTEDAAAAAAEERTARNALARDLDAVRTTIADPARDGQNTASALLRHQLLVVAGEAPDGDVGDRLVEQLRTAGAELEEAAATPMPQRPTTVAVAVVDPVFDRLTGLEAQATDLAERFVTAADEADAWLTAVSDLEAAARTYAASSDELPSGEDPGTIADAWRAEVARLEGYADAVEAAGGHRASATLAEAHGQLVTGMREVADDAIDRLEAGDLDGYNALLAERLGDDDPFDFRAALTGAREEVATDAVDGPLEATRARALGLLTELEQLRRTTPARLAGQPV